MRLTYLIGEPGVGKTTLLGAITDGLPGLAARRPFARTIYECGVVQLGEERPVFGGTDTLSMSVQPKVLDWAAMPDYPDIVAEGDRLANGKFFQGMRDLGYDLCIVLVTADPGEIASRRLRRAAAHNMKLQDPVWLQGRETKVRNLAQEWAARQVDTTDLDDALRTATTLPVLDTLWEAQP